MTSLLEYLTVLLEYLSHFQSQRQLELTTFGWALPITLAMPLALNSLRKLQLMIIATAFKIAKSKTKKVTNIALFSNHTNYHFVMSV